MRNDDINHNISLQKIGTEIRLHIFVFKKSEPNTEDRFN